MKKLLTLLVTAILAVTCCLGLTACGDDDNDVAIKEVAIPAIGDPFGGIEIKDDFKLGVICLHDESSTYDKNFIDSVKAAATAMGLKNSQLIISTGIAESDACTTEANRLVAQGCTAIFADSFSHEGYLKESAVAHPDVQYFHATGTNAQTYGLANFHNAFASIYEGRFLAGVAAGMKLKEMDEAGKIKDYNKEGNNVKIGYVGAFNYAEVISGYTSWYLGVKSVFPNVVMKVKYTSSWYDEAAERTTANTLINQGCALISQHADSMGAPSACESKGVPNVSYNGSTINACPNTFLISSKIDWTYYFKWIIASVGAKNAAEVAPIDVDYTGTIAEGMVALTGLNPKVMAAGTVKAIVDARKGLMEGTIKVFDTSTFTVKASAIQSLIDDPMSFTPITEFTLDDDTAGHITSLIVNGEDVIKTESGITYLAESLVRSAPYVQMLIEGIEVI